jgi:hypothetical protein
MIQPGFRVLTVNKKEEPKTVGCSSEWKGLDLGGLRGRWQWERLEARRDALAGNSGTALKKEGKARAQPLPLLPLPP